MKFYELSILAFKQIPNLRWCIRKKVNIIFSNSSGKYQIATIRRSQLLFCNVSRMLEILQQNWIKLHRLTTVSKKRKGWLNDD